MAKIKRSEGTAFLLEKGKGKATEQAFKAICILALILPLSLLFILIADAFLDGKSRLNWGFLTGYPGPFPDQAGFLPPLVGSAYLMVLTAAMAIPLGLCAAIYLEEYAKPNRLNSLIELNIANLAGVPSIIYGLLGLELFVRVMDWGRSLVAGAATLALLLLPMVIMTSREALRTVPPSLQEAALALGADRWTAVRKVVLPMSMPGVLTGIILSLARAIGETAPIITIGAITYINFLPDSLKSEFTAMPIQIFNWISRPQSGFRTNAAAGIVVLLALMLILNAFAIWLRGRLQRRIVW